MGVAEEIKKTKEALILLHHNADADVLGASIALARALAQLKIKTKIVAPADISKQSENVLKKYPYTIEKEVKEWPPLVIILDTVSPEQLGIELPEVDLILIDHHAPGELAKRAKATLIDDKAHSVSFIVYNLLRELGLEITKEIAFFLLISAIADTAYLRLVNKEELKTIVELLEKNIDLDDVYAALAVPEDISERIAKLKGSQRLDLYKANDLLIAFSHVGSYESSVATSLVKTGADIAIVFNAREDEIRISARERVHLKEKINLAEILKKIEPLIDGHAGGHPTAASANGKSAKDLEKIKKALLDSIAKQAKAKPQVI